MKKQKRIQKIVLAFQKTLLTMASFHLGIILYHYFLTKDLRLINAFHILDLQIFYQPLEDGLMNFVLSWIFIGAVFLTFFYFSRKK